MDQQNRGGAHQPLCFRRLAMLRSWRRGRLAAASRDPIDRITFSHVPGLRPHKTCLRIARVDQASHKSRSCVRKLLHVYAGQFTTAPIQLPTPKSTLSRFSCETCRKCLYLLKSRGQTFVSARLDPMGCRLKTGGASRGEVQRIPHKSPAPLIGWKGALRTGSARKPFDRTGVDFRGGSQVAFDRSQWLARLAATGTMPKAQGARCVAARLCARWPMTRKRSGRRGRTRPRASRPAADLMETRSTPSPLGRNSCAFARGRGEPPDCAILSKDRTGAP